jgi:hypothetical protein
MSRTITALNWNFENNGERNKDKRTAGHELLARLNPDLVLRQEMWGADDDGNTVMYELEDILGLRGWLGPKACTAVFANTELFAPVREYPKVGPMWVLPPTVLTLRYRPAGRSALPFAAGSYHLNYASTTNRLAEAEWLTNWADKKWITPEGRAVALPALFGGDNNSYPHEDLDDAPALPVRELIPDRPHRLHRSYPDPSGDRRMDTRPDAALREAGLVDVARYWATKKGDPKAVARTVNAYPTHGPDSRIDRIYTTEQLLPAVAGVDVIEVDEETSDHHIVRLKLDADTLTDILHERADLAA